LAATSGSGGDRGPFSITAADVGLLAGSTVKAAALIKNAVAAAAGEDKARRSIAFCGCVPLVFVLQRACSALEQILCQGLLGSVCVGDGGH
jgi:hypothetical protein